MKPRLAKLESPSEKEKLPKLVAIIQEATSAAAMRGQALRKKLLTL